MLDEAIRQARAGREQSEADLFEELRIPSVTALPDHRAELKAVEFALAAGGPPINVRFLIEGEEEITGHALGDYLRENAERLRTDYVLIWDGGFTDADEPALSTGLRGILYVELKAT